MLSAQDFEYALESTRVVVEPQQLIETFGSTSFRFLLVTEFLDEVQKVRVRDGKIEAERPRIVAPHHFQKMLLDGFGDRAQEFADWMQNHAEMVKILRYGFQFTKTDLSEEVVHQPLEQVVERLEKEISDQSQPGTALITGLDDSWEICLLKFTSDLIRKSAGENMGEWQRRGLL